MHIRLSEGMCAHDMPPCQRVNRTSQDMVKKMHSPTFLILSLLFHQCLKAYFLSFHREDVICCKPLSDL